MNSWVWLGTKSMKSNSFWGHILPTKVGSETTGLKGWGKKEQRKTSGPGGILTKMRNKKCQFLSTPSTNGNQMKRKHLWVKTQIKTFSQTFFMWKWNWWRIIRCFEYEKIWKYTRYVKLPLQCS